MSDIITNRRKIDLAYEKLVTVCIQKSLHYLKGTNNRNVPGVWSSRIRFNAIFVFQNFWLGFNKKAVRQENKYVSVFGFDLKLKQHNDMVVEANVGIKESSNTASFFGVEGKHLIWYHNGDLRGLGRDEFFEWLEGEIEQNIYDLVIEVINRNSREDRVTKICEVSLTNDEFENQIEQFVYAMAAFKKFKNQENPSEGARARSNNAATDRSRRTINYQEVAKISEPPKQIVSISTGFYRNPQVAIAAKELADGSCDFCGKIAPFTDAEGNAFLECHHIDWLSRGGPDTLDNTVALCPNCHRRMHILDSEEDKEILWERVENRQIPQQ